MAYTYNNIVENFRGLIGFMPSYDVSNVVASIDESLSQSQSGQYVNELNSLFTPEIFSNVAQQFVTFTTKGWSNTATYTDGAVVRHDGFIYEAVNPVIGNAPGLTDGQWRKTTLLSIWFRRKYDGAVLSLIDSLIEYRKLEGHGKQLRGNTALYEAKGAKNNLITKSGRFVGYRINLKQQNLSAVLQRVGVQITGNQRTLPIHVMYNGQDNVIDLNFNGGGSFSWADVPSQISLQSGSGDAFIGYYEDDLENESAIFTSTDVFNDGIRSCCSPYYNYRQSWDGYMGITPISRDSDGDITEYTNTNFGLNLVFSYGCDLSDILIRQKQSLVPALKSQLRVTFLNEIAATTRNNQEADQVSILAFNQLNDFDDPFNPKKVLRDSLKALSFEFSGNSACLPCTNRTKVKSNVI